MDRFPVCVLSPVSGLAASDVPVGETSWSRFFRSAGPVPRARWLARTMARDRPLALREGGVFFVAPPSYLVHGKILLNDNEKTILSALKHKSNVRRLTLLLFSSLTAVSIDDLFGRILTREVFTLKCLNHNNCRCC